jgi:hypothetical protein
MMGIGPNGSSLLERLPSLVVLSDDSEPWQMAMEQQARGQARLENAIRHHRKKPPKPLAPIEFSHMGQKPDGKFERLWVWLGENIPSKGLVKTSYYTAKEIRDAGFKLPPIKKKEKD